MGKIMLFFKTMLMAHMMPKSLLAAINKVGKENPLHYRPLNGNNLMEMSQKKMHHGADRFINPMGLPRDKRLLQVLSWKLFHKNQYSAFLDDQKVTPVNMDWDPVKSHRGVSVSFIKHATLLIRDQGQTIVVDPVYNDIGWFYKDHSPMGSGVEKMPGPDHVLITHGHYDHLDKPSLASLSPDTHVITPLGYNKTFKDLGMANHTELDWFESYGDKKREIILVPANHWTMRNPFIGPNRSLWGGYLIKTAGGPTIYISGDTAYFDGFDQFAHWFDIDLAIFNLGAYAPRWFMAQSHINPYETVQAFSELKARKLMIAHWGTFRLGDEPVHFPPEDLGKVLKKAGLLSRWVDLKHGETYYF